MKRELLEATRRIETSKTIDRVWAIVIDAITAYELNYAIYITNSDSQPHNWFVRSTLKDNWPFEETQNPEFTEPFLEHCCATFEISKMGVEFISDHSGYINEATKSYIQKIAETGWRSALGIPCRLRGSGRHGGFIIGNSMNRYDFERSIFPQADTFQTFCLIVHRKLEELYFNKQSNIERKPLSPREYQTLDLISKGLRPKQIAATLNVSEASVRLYLKNARAKLGATTKEEALVIFLQDIQELR